MSDYCARCGLPHTGPCLRPPRDWRIYSRKDIGVMAFTAGLLSGMVVGFAACTPNPDEANEHITTWMPR